MVEVKPINLSLNQHSPGLSVRMAISPTLTEEFIIHPSVYSEIKKLGHAKSDVLLSESGSSLGAHAYAYPNVVSVSNVIENSSYDLSHVKNFNTRSDSSSLIKNYKFLVCSVFFVCFRFSSGIHGKEKRNTYRCGQRTVRIAVVAAKAKQSSRAGAAKDLEPFLETGSAGRRRGQGRRQATTPNEDRYLVLTAPRHRNMNATLLQQHLRSATGTTVST
ncbi:transposable element Tcb2 transposase [Trichonephila clavipes]|nr:transposable element Tcb2 transposase [Trichonephila clavipes]